MTSILLILSVFFLAQSVSADTSPQTEEIRFIPFKTLPQQDGLTSFRLTVQGAEQADTELIDKLRSESHTFLQTGIGVSTLGLIEAVAIPSLYSSALVAGAIIVVPLSVAIGVMDKRTHDTVENTLKENSLVEILRQRFRRHLTNGLEVNNGSTQLQITVLAYGLSSDPECLFADAAIQVLQQSRVVYEDFIYIEPFLRSADAPPPYCYSMEVFAKNDGELLEKGLIEYSQVIHAIVKKRTALLPWQD